MTARGADDPPAGRAVDPAPLVVGAFVAAAGGLFLAEPYVDPLPVGALRVRPVALSAVALSAGLLLGAAVYLRRGRRLVGLAHLIGGGGWALVVVGTTAGSGVLLFAGLTVLVGGTLFLAGEAARPR